MANIPTTPVSLNDIHVAVGGAHETEVSLNDTDVRAATNLTLDSAYSVLHGAGIDTTNESTISIHEFRNAFYNTGSITYNLGFSIGDANLNETDDRSATLLFTVSNYGTAETYYWRIDNGSSDFTTSSGTITTSVGGGGSFTSADFNIQTVTDNLTEDTENFHIRVASDSGFNTILASATVSVDDTSLTPITYAGDFDVDSINEDGSLATFTVTTTGVTDGTTVGYTITGIDAADINLSSLTGTITINSNAGTVSFTANADMTTENAETVTLTLASTDSTGASVGTVSDTVIINDTSKTPAVPTYTIQGSDPLSINETSGATTITVNTANVSNGTKLYWNITTDQSGSTQASTDWAAYNSGGLGFTISSDTGSFTIDASADNTTEGNITYYLQVRTGSDTGTIVDSIALTVVDDSLDAAPSYTLTESITSVDEGSSVSFTIGGTNLPDGVVYLQINNLFTSDIDFDPALTGNRYSVTVSGGTGTSGSFTLDVDTTTEGAETFGAEIYDASTGGNLLASSGTITVIDTSLSPSATSTMDVYPLYSTNGYTVSVSNIVSTGATTSISKAEGYLLVEESGSDIIVYAAAGGAVLTGSGNSSTTSSLYKSENSTSSTAMTPIPETGTDYSNKEECFRISGLGGAGWSVSYGIDHQDAWATSPSGKAITWNPTTGHPTTIYNNYGDVTTSAQTITSGTNSKRALRFKLVALSGEGDTEINQQNDGSIRLTFSKSGQTDINVDTKWSLQCTALSSTSSGGGGGLGGGGAGGAN